MGNKLAFEPYLKALKALGGTAAASQIGEDTGSTSDSVNGVFNYHVRTCKDNGATPMVRKVARGLWTVNQPAKPEPKPVKARNTPKAVSNTADDLFERIGCADDGTIIVRGVDTQKMYRLGAL